MALRLEVLKVIYSELVNMTPPPPNFILGEEEEEEEEEELIQY